MNAKVCAHGPRVEDLSRTGENGCLKSAEGGYGHEGQAFESTRRLQRCRLGCGVYGCGVNGCGVHGCGVHGCGVYGYGMHGCVVYGYGERARACV